MADNLITPNLSNFASTSRSVFALLLCPIPNPMANKIIKKTLKTKLDKAKGYWLDLLPEVLWSYRTTFHTSTGETPFFISFSTEFVVPVEIDQPFHQTSAYDAEANDEQLVMNLDLITKLRDQAQMSNFAYK
ncbi:uncharacterized protein LOC109948106 [Prunus persica]|uniref:uncharacterized protein LOC109948106 n=1 Tax=Prunus persica TaxID=3760 RepID=UPI0009AB2552|nr:uncharacterized protein LOC109948106 [Prunus persica]